MSALAAPPAVPGSATAPAAPLSSMTISEPLATPVDSTESESSSEDFEERGRGGPAAATAAVGNGFSAFMDSDSDGDGDGDGESECEGEGEVEGEKEGEKPLDACEQTEGTFFSSAPAASKKNNKKKKNKKKKKNNNNKKTDENEDEEDVEIPVLPITESAHVILHSLVGSAHLNGASGTVISYVPEKDRWNVALDDDGCVDVDVDNKEKTVVQLRPVNLTVITEMEYEEGSTNFKLDTLQSRKERAKIMRRQKEEAARENHVEKQNCNYTMPGQKQGHKGTQKNYDMSDFQQSSSFADEGNKPPKETIKRLRMQNQKGTKGMYIKP